MSEPRDYLPELLDRVRAVIECGAGKPVELARFVLPGASVEGASVQVNRWLKEETKPNGESTLKIQAWTAVKTLEIDAGGEATRETYRKAFAKTASGKKHGEA